MKKRVFTACMSAALTMALLSGCSVPFVGHGSGGGADTQQASQASDQSSANAAAPDKVDPGSSQDSAASISVAQLVQGQIPQASDDQSPSDPKGWYSFKTGDKAGETYHITVVNASNTDGDGVTYYYLYDADGEQIKSNGTAGNGRPNSITTNDLAANTKYYVGLNGAEGAGFYLLITSDQQPYNIANNMEILAGDASSAEGNSVSYEAQLVPFGRKLSQSVSADGYDWYAFQTDGEENATYHVTVIATGSDDLSFDVIDQNGDDPQDSGNGSAPHNGTAGTLTSDSLEPNTTYLIGVSGEKTAPYYLAVTKNDQESVAGANSDDDSEEPDQSSTSVTAGTNQANAPLLSAGTKATGKLGKDTTDWYAFKTGATENADYYVSVVNMTTGSGDISADLRDEQGNDLQWVSAHNDGAASTIQTDELEPNATYYIALSGEKDTAYAVIVRSSDDQSGAASLTSNLASATLSDSSAKVGTNQIEATMLQLGGQASAQLRKDIHDWYAFKTTSVQNATYHVTVVNTTPGSQPVWFGLRDEYGSQISSTDANNSGTAATLTSDQLKPNTTYYVDLSGDKNTGYTISVSVEGADAQQASEAKLAFAQPFSLDETQVQFVINSDKFADESAAKKALQPVAEQILKYPDHKILIAGTTATWGSQSYVQDLSDRRAAAVKNSLVNDFKVPADQLITVGLGYEKDPFERAADRDISGNFIESEAKKNRRVVILDAEDATAKKIIADNQ